MYKSFNDKIEWRMDSVSIVGETELTRMIDWWNGTCLFQHILLKVTSGQVYRSKQCSLPIPVNICIGHVRAMGVNIALAKRVGSDKLIKVTHK